MNILSYLHKNIYVVVLLFIVLQSCNLSTNDYLRNAELLVQTDPDSTLNLLNSIPISKLSNKDDLHNYNLLQIKAKDKLYKDITQDTAIFQAATYFSKKKDIEKLVEATYYCGRLYHELGEREKAISTYLEADKYAEGLDGSYQMKGLILANIGYLFFDESEYEESLSYLKKSLKYVHDANKIDNEISIIADIGNCYLMLDKSDSAYFYYNKSLSLADVSNSAVIKLKALQNLALVYQLQENYTESINLYRQVLPLADSIMTAKVYLSLARVYSHIGNKDSVNYYFKRAKEIGNDLDNPYFMASLYNVSSEINEESGNYEKALIDYKEYAKNIERFSDEQEKKVVLNIQKKYQYERVRNENNKLYIRNMELLVLLLIVSVLFILSFIFLRNRIKQNKRSLEEAENKISELNHLASSYDEKHTTFRSILLHQFDIMKKSAMIQNYLRKDEITKGEKLLKKFNDIVYKQEELDWDMLYGVMNELHYGFLDKLKSLVPDLDESEYRICCLIYSDFTNQEIGIIMKLSSSTITHKRSSIRKKMGLEDYSNISEYLKDLSKKL